ncbi:BASS family bile acid:Na+ symporter [Natronospira proteinivora]|uniref:BASS family bile acid:Na+ symporter n=1 Tax=Natronospira proteinivora TaxID=1807133 RepID=A0ABT1G5I1_9GAMM|nr:bile acid:sodium symporter [Natronospira proteinivora]MCP1726545.1 BASS family bile acid:Na+ symporter [Natronospira proteinivora]
MLTPLEEQLLAIMMVVIMLGMGASLTFKDFRMALRNPQAIGIGFASQYLFMPLIAFMLAQAFNLSGPQTIGLVLMGCVPGGTTSNIFAYFSKSMLSLSILMTICSTIAAFLMVPLVMEVYTRGIDEALRIPPDNIARILFVLLIPTLIGMWVRKKNPNFGAVTELIGGLLGVIVIIFLLVTWIPRNWDLLLETSFSVYGAAIFLGLCGFIIGYFFSRTFRLDRRKARTVSLETGIQNGPLAILIVALTFDEEVLQQEVMLIPVMYSLFIVINSTFITLYYRARSNREEIARDRAKVEPAK